MAQAKFDLGKIVDVIGVIDYVRYKKSPLELEVYCPKSRKKYLLICEFPCPAKERDLFTATCRLLQTTVGGKLAGTLRVISPPLVQIPTDRESVIRCFIQVLNKTGFGERRAAGLYDTLENLASSAARPHDGGAGEAANHTVVAYISSLAHDLTKWGDEGMLNGYAPHATPDQMRKLLLWWNKNFDIRRLLLLGLTREEIRSSCLETEELYARCLKNPFTVANLSMEKCTQILARQDKKPTSSDIECGKILRFVWENMQKRQWTATPSFQVLRRFPDLPKLFSRLEQEYELCCEKESLYLKKALEIEKKVAAYFARLMELDQCSQEIFGALREREASGADGDGGEEVGLVTAQGEPLLSCAPHVTGKISLSPDQMAALQAALERKVCIITGGAGAGKTTVIGQIVENLELREESYAVCSFTGKAVSRVKQVLGKGRAERVSTIHRMIMRARSPEAGAKFRTLIIDEVSMVTCELFAQLIEAYPHEFRLVMVGDVNQLPPIGWGSLFAQCIAAGTFPTFYLSVNHRVYQVEGEHDGILDNAHRILTHSRGRFVFSETKNFTLVSGRLERVFDIIKICRDFRIPQEQVIVLTPFNKDLVALNAAFQQIYNEETRNVVDPQGVLWHVGDRVRMKENNYEINVMNGELGRVKNMTGDALIVDFGESGTHEFKLKIPPRSYNYEPQEDGMGVGKSQSVEYLEHAYAISIHRYQGSESDFVVIYIPETKGGSFLNKNLLYTAVTRAKRAVWLVGDDAALSQAAVMSGARRHEHLADRLRDLLPQVAPVGSAGEDPAETPDYFDDNESFYEQLDCMDWN